MTEAANRFTAGRRQAIITGETRCDSWGTTEQLIEFVLFSIRLSEIRVKTARNFISHREKVVFKMVVLCTENARKQNLPEPENN